MARIIRQRDINWLPEVQVFYARPGYTDWGYGFDANEDGTLKTAGLSRMNLDTIAECEAQGWEKSITRRQVKQIQPAVIECDCGRTISLWGDTCCGCGRWYDIGGSLLSNPIYWGEETGECFSRNGSYLGGGYDE